MMALPKRYDPTTAEPEMIERWQEEGVYHFDPEQEGPVYSIDTPPPTVSGRLHLGHVYSYSHADFMARFWRMKGRRVFYPMGYDDNGLPTERLVERQLGITATEVGRRVFIEKCLQVSEEAEVDYEALWKRLGLSIDWRYTYRTIDDLSRRTSQLSFLDLYRKGYVYRQESPSIWCPECRTAIAQAELNDLERGTEFVTLRFKLEDGEDLPIATTRQELLPACVAIFVHPEDERFRDLVGMRAAVPLFGQKVPILEDPEADPEKGTGVVMCCTFGDQTDVAWWYTHDLDMVEGIDSEGRLTEAAGEFAGLMISEGRDRIKEALAERGLISERTPSSQSVRVHERCDTPVEYIVTKQWFINALDHKEKLLEAGEGVHWYPDHMQARYRAWVEGLSWDWCISRQRYFGVPFPVWYCTDCGEVLLATEDQLPVDPSDEQPTGPCSCGGTEFIPEQDVMDTWATSSLSPQIVSRWLTDEHLYEQTFPMTLRPQAHEIIRTWAFYTILKSVYHFDVLPWRDVLISGWGLAGPGMPKVSKSRGGGPLPPMEMIERYSADAVRYWASSTGPGKDSIISEDKIQLGSKLVTKLWNVARFSARFLEGYQPDREIPELTSADRWILSQLQSLVARATELFENYDYAAAKSETEAFFWRDLADNYIEMAKQRLYDAEHPRNDGARYTLYHVLLGVLKLFAPLLPHVTEEIYQGLFRETEGAGSIHIAVWPNVDGRLLDETAQRVGGMLVEIATSVRRYKSERSLKLSLELARLQLAVEDAQTGGALQEAASDLMSVTRAQNIDVVEEVNADLEIIYEDEALKVALEP
jgi:valyl-tRNA synthetase